MAWTYAAPTTGSTTYATTMTNCVTEIQNAVDARALLAGSSSQAFACSTLTASGTVSTGALTVTGSVRATDEIVALYQNTAVVHNNTGFSINTGYSVGYLRNTNASGTAVDTHYEAASHIFESITGTEWATISSTGLAVTGSVRAITKIYAGTNPSGVGAPQSGWIFDDSLQTCVTMHSDGAASGSVYNYFNYAGGTIGSISQNGTTAVSYNTSSDYRLKEITDIVTNSGSFVDALKPKVGTWKADGSKFVGFLAHEFAEVSPLSVCGEKDAVDKDGKPIYQSMQASSSEVMANIVAELQSLRIRLKALEATS